MESLRVGELQRKQGLNMAYRITAIIIKKGQQPTNWTRFSKKELSKAECEKLVDGQIIEFKCVSV